MDLKKYYVNFHFEDQLYSNQKISLINKPIQLEMEFIYFYMQKEASVLMAANSYQPRDLEAWAKMKCQIPLIESYSEEALPWWGSLENRELQKTLNSKKLSFAVLSNLKLLPNECRIYKREELPQSFEGKILKGFHGYSGAANYLPPFNMANIKGEEFIVEPFFKVCLNLGHMINGNTYSHYLILNRSSGSFMGGVNLCAKKMKKLLECYKIELSEIEEKLTLITQEYRKHGADQYLQIDSFIYEEKGVFKLYIGHDIQHRKTMGNFLLELRNFCSHPDYLWLNFPKGKFKVVDGLELGHNQKKWSSICAPLHFKSVENLTIVNDVNSSYNKLCSNLANILKHHED